LHFVLCFLPTLLAGKIGSAWTCIASLILSNGLQDGVPRAVGSWLGCALPSVAPTNYILAGADLENVIQSPAFGIFFNPQPGSGPPSARLQPVARADPRYNLSRDPRPVACDPPQNQIKFETLNSLYLTVLSVECDIFTAANN
jgi:hypothetical protein